MGTLLIDRISLVTLALVMGAAMASPAVATQAPSDAALIDSPGFLDLSVEALEYRKGRLIDIDTFEQYQIDPNTLVLDTRSADAFAAGHLRGAVHLEFADFTQSKLDALIPSPDTRILIYCNNNFRDNTEPVPLKRVQLALNIPTFINLIGYGYRNVYELGSLVALSDVDWTGAPNDAKATE